MSSPESFTDIANKREGSILRYPLDLGSKRIAHYMHFDIYKFIKNDTLEAQRPDLRASFALPIPANLSSERSYDYSDEELGIIGKGAVDQSREGFDRKSFVDEVSSIEGEDIKKFVGDALKTAAISASSTAAESFGAVKDPKLVSQFTGLGFRSHTFTWELIARSRQESEQIGEIITLMEYHSAPVSSRFYIEKPDVFHIRFAPAQIERHLYLIGYTNLTNISVSYNGGGTPAFFRNSGAPVQIGITATFKETTIGFRNRLVREYQKRSAPGFSNLPPVSSS